MSLSAATSIKGNVLSTDAQSAYLSTERNGAGSMLDARKQQPGSHPDQLLHGKTRCYYYFLNF